MFPKWRVEYLTTWYWVKVTKNGDPIVPFNTETQKQPYEIIVRGRRIPVTPRLELDELKTTKVILSIPSSLHSHKPPLIDILKKFLITPEGTSSDGGNNCEIFARYLIPGFTSFGNEVIKLQHSSLYIDMED